MIGFIAVVAVTVELRLEGSRIGACSRDATTLSKVSAIVRSALYGDTEQFLGKSFRPFEQEHNQALEIAYVTARASASRCRALFYSGAAARAREIYLAAEQERNFAAEPRGNWMSYMAEVAKAHTQFEVAKGRFDLERPAIVSGDDRQRLESAVVRALLPVAEASWRADRRTWDQRLKKEEAAKAEAAIVEAERLRTALAERGPSNTGVSNNDFQWTWEDGAPPSIVIGYGGGTKVGPGRTEVLVFKNRTPWRMYSVGVAFEGWDVAVAIGELAPGEERRRELSTDRPDRFHPKPNFFGSFVPP
jgi:hypothetical protein